MSDDGTSASEADPTAPADDEMAAIVAAVEVSWPRPGASGGAAAPPRWRFAGRWWSKPVPARRERPW